MKANIIIVNKKASFLYELKQKFEAGIVLEGWEVKSIKAKNIQITESYLSIKNDEIFALNMIINPLITASTHSSPDRIRKILMHKKQIKRISGTLSQKGYSLIPINLKWENNKIKLTIALAIGRKNYDKRQKIRDREWKNSKSII